MAEAKINDQCIIGLPTCGYAFNSSRMAFIAAPSDDEFQLEVDVLTALLEDKSYEPQVALRALDPGKFAFCTKICSKIIQSQFCIVLLDPSQHATHADVSIPNPNVHMEYGLMLAFKKYVIPFQREGQNLAFNIQPLDTVKYTKAEFRRVADEVIDAAILATETTGRPARALASSEALLRYIAVRGLKVTNISTKEGGLLYQLGSGLGFNLLDGEDIVYFGLFDRELAKEIVFRLKLLLRNLHKTYDHFQSTGIKGMSVTEIRAAEELWSKIQIEILLADDHDATAIEARVQELTASFTSIPWKLMTQSDIDDIVTAEYVSIGDL